MLVQGRNNRKNVMITYKDETHCLSEWADILGFSSRLLRDCLNSNTYSIERAFTEPVQNNGRKSHYKEI